MLTAFSTDVYSFIIDFLPATHTKRKENRFPLVRKADDEMAMDTQTNGNMTGGPVYSNGGGANGYGNEQPTEQNGRYYPPQQNVQPGRNF